MLIPIHQNGLTPLIHSSLGRSGRRSTQIPEVIDVSGWGEDDVGSGAFQIEAGDATKKKLDQATMAINGVSAVGVGLGSLLIGLILGYVLGRD